MFPAANSAVGCWLCDWKVIDDTDFCSLANLPSSLYHISDTKMPFCLYINLMTQSVQNRSRGLLVWRHTDPNTTYARVWCQPYTMICTPQQDFCRPMKWLRAYVMSGRTAHSLEGYRFSLSTLQPKTPQPQQPGEKGGDAIA